ncbi:hypothetical protein WQ57_11985 [Mesobacillus campisalis]|uniref:Amino acid transporter n=1 Tax=Mesobacillus campisalis TaxID=1408103 RepID=A0A0M2SY42_9BACI|nr:hypothetical protein [Mesobacillus campisalis]KKK37887.1 hypothetical protein WQ57_11985 [Mesobacillus campisalis]
MADILFSHESQLAAVALLGAFHGINPAMGWLFAVFLSLQRNDQKVLYFAILPIGIGQMLGDGFVIALQTAARFHFPIHTVHLAIASFISLYGIYRLFRYYRHIRWTGGLKVGYGQLVLWSFLASSTHGSGLLFAPFILSAERVTDLLPLWFFHELAMLASMTAMATLVYKFGVHAFKKYIVNFELAWAVLLIAVGILLFIMSGGGSSDIHMH